MFKCICFVSNITDSYTEGNLSNFIGFLQTKIWKRAAIMLNWQPVMVKKHFYTAIKQDSHIIQKFCNLKSKSINASYLSIIANTFRPTANGSFMPSITLISQKFAVYPLMNLEQNGWLKYFALTVMKKYLWRAEFTCFPQKYYQIFCTSC